MCVGGGEGLSGGGGNYKDEGYSLTETVFIL